MSTNSNDTHLQYVDEGSWVSSNAADLSAAESDIEEQLAREDVRRAMDDDDMFEQSDIVDCFEDDVAPQLLLSSDAWDDFESQTILTELTSF